ncbi:MAG: choice-of-anchor D domain-containing protein [Tepidisphaeraceae bacterium]
MAANATILSGDIGAAGDNSDNSYHVVVGSGTDRTAVLDGFTISDGNANGDSNGEGGGMYIDAGSPTITNCTFSGNSASYNGGGMYNISSSSPTLTNCTFGGNSAQNGGGMYNVQMYDSSGNLPMPANCTFSGNTAGLGGGIFNSNSDGGAILTNCTLSGNPSADGGGINADPRFIRNPSPGKDGIWGTADDDYGDLRLQRSSPCIDAGSNAAVPKGITTDLAGKPRFMDVPGVHGSNVIVDMGAYEVAGNSGKVSRVTVAMVSPAATIKSGQSAAVSFGTARVGETVTSKAFRVTNTGTANLILGKISVPAGYQLMHGLVATLKPGKSDVFTIKLVTRKAGKYGGTVKLGTNTAARTFQFSISGTVTAK